MTHPGSAHIPVPELHGGLPSRRALLLILCARIGYNP